MPDAALAGRHSLAPVASGDNLPAQLGLSVDPAAEHEVVLEIRGSPKKRPRGPNGSEDHPAFAAGRPHDEGLGF